jgi:flavodoxin/NAD-dependent dihydropyrimidine dehydrogenase PreA subunit
MKTIIVYYSQTGNTKKIAYAVHSGMNRTGEQCEITRLKDVDPQRLTDYDLIGLGSPVVHEREYPHVAKFISSMKSVDGKHAFAFSTHGATPGNYFARVVPALIQRGLTVIGWNDWFGSAYHPLIPKPYFTDGHPDWIDLKEAEEFGREMVERSRRIYQRETSLIPVLPQGAAYDERYFPVAGASESFKKLVSRTEFRVTEKCNYPRCTYCMDNCPTHAIDMSTSPPTFDRNCDLCWLCEQTCPNAAIEIDYGPLDIAHQPLTISVLQKSLNAFESKGLFRRLTPLENIGWDNTVWKAKPPRFKIDY